MEKPINKQEEDPALDLSNAIDIELANSIKVGIIGGAGHIGCSLSLVLANKGYNVIGYDTNTKLVNQLNSGQLPYMEEGGQELLTKLITSDRLYFSDSIKFLRSSRVIFITIGTPLGGNSEPKFNNLFRVAHQLAELLTERTIIAIRSTVSPGITEKFQNMLNRRARKHHGMTHVVISAPERILQGQGIKESDAFPQIIGMDMHLSEAVVRVTLDIMKAMFTRILLCSHVDAELGKLMCNAWRYSTFALANEFHMIATRHGGNFSMIRKLFSIDYPRFSIPSAGPNVGGPCLRKDTKFLTWDSPINHILDSAIKVNEGMPGEIANYVVSILRTESDLKSKRICILGSEFKRDIDDSRDSLTPKLVKILQAKGYSPTVYSPIDLTFRTGCKVIHRKSDIPDKTSVFILMTPHSQFQDVENLFKDVKSPYMVIDLWNMWSPQVMWKVSK